jgi:hypothetical protein
MSRSGSQCRTGRGHHRLHHRDAGAHHHARREQHRKSNATPRSAVPSSDDEQTADERAAHADARDEQRAPERGQCEQRGRDAAEHPDLRRRKAEVGADHRQHRRHRENGQAQRDAAQPQEEQRPPARAACGLGHCGANERRRGGCYFNRRARDSGSQRA